MSSITKQCSVHEDPLAVQFIVVKTPRSSGKMHHNQPFMPDLDKGDALHIELGEDGSSSPSEHHRKGTLMFRGEASGGLLHANKPAGSDGRQMP